MRPMPTTLAVLEQEVVLTACGSKHAWLLLALCSTCCSAHCSVYLQLIGHGQGKEQNMTVQLNSTSSPTAIVVLLHLSLNLPPMMAARPKGNV